MIGGDSWRWEKGKCHTIFKKNKDIVGKYMPVSRTSASRKSMEQILSEDISRHVTDKKIIGNSQHEFSKGNWYLTDLIAFMVKWLALGRRVHKSPTVFFQTNEKIRRVENWLSLWAQRFLIGHTMASWQLVSRPWSQGQYCLLSLLTSKINGVYYQHVCRLWSLQIGNSALQNW